MEDPAIAIMRYHLLTRNAQLYAQPVSMRSNAPTDAPLTIWDRLQAEVESMEPIPYEPAPEQGTFEHFKRGMQNLSDHRWEMLRPPPTGEREIIGRRRLQEV